LSFAIFVWIFLFLITVTVHEVCHGLVAYAMGDPTAKQHGRLTLNPLKHIDPFWTVLLPGLLFFGTGGRFAIGMAKPVPVDFSRLHPLRLGMILVALAGPLANFVLAFVFSLGWSWNGNTFFLYGVYFNLGLALFNLIPIPPLDGSRIVTGLLPRQLALDYVKLEKFGFIIILILYFTGILFNIILPALNFCGNLLGVPILRFY